MIVDDFSTVLRPVNQAVGAGLVDQPGGTTRKIIDLIDCAIRENIIVSAVIGKAPFHIPTNLCPIQNYMVIIAVNHWTGNHVNFYIK